MKNVSDLEGRELDYWAAKADGRNDVVLESDRCVSYRCAGLARTYSPSTEWMFGGPIIERERITVMAMQWTGEWSAGYGDDKTDFVGNRPNSQTPLVAAMRRFVESKFGTKVPDTKE